MKKRPTHTNEMFWAGVSSHDGSVFIDPTDVVVNRIYLYIYTLSIVVSFTLLFVFPVLQIWIMYIVFMNAYRYIVFMNAYR